MTTIRILGIDPGSVKTGVGIIDVINHSQHRLVHAETLVLNKEPTFPDRLGKLFNELERIITTFQPSQAGIETVFLAKSPMAALKLGQARGAAIAAMVRCGLPVNEYEPRLVKQCLVGKGSADKTQVQHMVGILLNHKQPLQADAADALAIALTHAHISATAARTGVAASELARRR